jgi:hypothetical protein
MSDDFRMVQNAIQNGDYEKSGKDCGQVVPRTHGTARRFRCTKKKKKKMKIPKKTELMFKIR